MPIAGTVDGVAQTLTGTLAITRFATQQNQLVAIGTLTATVRDGTGNIVRNIVTHVAVPVTLANGSCTILHLELGPLELKRTGLMIHLDRIVLDISAQPGGGLLGDLLCAIAGLLEPLTLGQQLVKPAEPDPRRTREALAIARAGKGHVRVARRGMSPFVGLSVRDSAETSRF